MAHGEFVWAFGVIRCYHGGAVATICVFYISYCFESIGQYLHVCIEFCILKGIRKTNLNKKKDHFAMLSVSFLAYFVYNKKYDARPDNRKGNETQYLHMRKPTQSRSYTDRYT